MNITIKVVLIGDENTGKAKLRELYLGRSFIANYMMTIGADFALKQVKIQSGKKLQTINVQIWDLASQDHFSKVRTLYYKGLKGLIAVIDVTRYDSYKKLMTLLDGIKKVISDASNIPVLLIGNNYDLRRENERSHISPEFGEEIAEKISKLLSDGRMKVNYIETSIKTGKNVDLAFNNLIETIVRVQQDSDVLISELKSINKKMSIILWSKTGLGLVQKNLISCPYCYEEIFIWSKFCPECGHELSRCHICKRILEKIEVTCPNCQYSFHKTHWIEYYQIKGTCPICQK